MVELTYFRNAHFFGMAFVVKKNIGFDPENVGLFCAGRVLFEPQSIAILLEEFFPLAVRMCPWARIGCFVNLVVACDCLSGEAVV
jgi:hypothetical protein